MTLREIDFPAKDVPLRKDVDELGTLVGEMLREQEGEAFFRLVEETRRAAIRRRQGEEGSAVELDERVCGLSPEEAGELTRAFSAYFQVVNLAEQVHRVRRRRDYLGTEGEVQPGSLRATLESLREGGVEGRFVADLFRDLRVVPVFTAHPTEATRRIVLEKEQRIARALVERLDGCTPPREREIRARIREEITGAWQTDPHPRERPTVDDEREHVLFYLTEVLWPVVPDVAEGLERAAATVFGQAATETGTYGEGSPEGRGPESPDPGSAGLVSPVRFASWVGGDMDGNPNVTAATIRDTLDRHRELALERHRSDLLELSSFLSQSPRRVEVDPEVSERVDAYAALLPEALEEIPARQRDLPYRLLLRLMGARLGAALEDGEGAYASADELSEDLRLVARSLERHGGRHAGLRGVRRVLSRVEVFGFHLAALDTRQDALVHRRVVGRLLDREGWMEAPARDRSARLRQALEDRASPAGSADPDDDEALRTLEVFRALKAVRKRRGPGAVGPFIVSMTEGPDDVLSVLYLARRAGFSDGDGHVPLDVAPLLETVSDLESAPGILEALLEDPVYRKHLRNRGDRQVVMIGYSDSNKDGGVTASRWALHSAQKSVVDVLGEAGIALTIFHGRGGTVGRGGGKTHRAVLAAPRGSVAGTLRVTEQGEIINEKYGLPEIAQRELERMVGATALAAIRPARSEGREERWERIMGTVARESRRAYRSLVHEDQLFPRYFRLATPIDVIERMPIGSRPASRRSGRGVEDLRAIPWVFSWMQSRHLLPGWYGLGAGLEAGVEEEGREAVEEMLREWPFLGSVLEDVEMALAKADLSIAERYAALAGDPGRAIFPRIREEFRRTVAAVTELRGRDGILDDDPTLRRSIRLRNPYVDPMSLLQVDLLRRWRETDRRDDRLLDALVNTVIGIAEGMRNTG